MPGPADETLTGGCYCGAIRYESIGPVRLRAQCHCRACQHIAGGGPNYFMLVRPEGFRFLSGQPQEFTRPDLPAAVTRAFCGTCGTHLTTRRPGLEEIVLKVGTLDDPARFDAPAIAIFAEDKQPFHLFPEGAPVFDQLPPRRA